MADSILETRVWLPKPRPEVFAFFADPRNLARVTPPHVRLRLLSAATPMAAGAVYDFRLTWFGVPLRWRLFIREFDPPVRFIDVQVRGPWDRWEHRHLFLEERGGTWMEDRLVYRLPLGAVGQAAHALIVGRQVAAAWRYRRRRVGELLCPVYDEPR
jgi:ligand-binding SRPBCC domain-containing protein